MTSPLPTQPTIITQVFGEGEETENLFKNLSKLNTLDLSLVYTSFKTIRSWLCFSPVTSLVKDKKKCAFTIEIGSKYDLWK